MEGQKVFYKKNIRDSDTILFINRIKVHLKIYLRFSGNPMD